MITVKKEKRLINIDSQVPNKVFHEWIEDSNYFKDICFIKPEYKYKNSRFDFFMENESRKILVEVKGVTLEKEGVALFPDAPTERGIKHLNELVQSLQEGYEAYVVFIIQMKDILYFSPNYETHRAFAEALIRAEKQGVRLLLLIAR